MLAVYLSAYGCLWPVVPLAARSVSSCAILGARSVNKHREDNPSITKLYDTKSISRNRWSKSPGKLQQLRYTRHILNLTAKGKIPEAIDMYDTMRGNGSKPEVIVYNAIIAAYGKQGKLSDAFKMFNQMKKHGHIPTDHTYSSLLSACARAGPGADSTLAKIENEMEKRNVRLNNIGSNAHISALSAVREQEDALKAFLDMTKLGNSPDLRTYSSLLQLSARDGQGGLVVAQRVWQELTVSGCTPDIVSYNLLLQCLRDAGLEGAPVKQLEQVCYVPPINIPGCVQSHLSQKPKVCSLTKVTQTGCVDFTLSRGTVLGLCVGYHGSTQLRWLDNLALSVLFQKLSSDKLKVDIRTYQLLLQLVLSPDHVISHMTKNKLKPDERIILTAIRGQTRLGDMAGAKTLMKFAGSLGLCVEQSGYQLIASRLHRETEGLALLDSIKSEGLVPGEGVFEALLSNSLDSRQYEYSTTLLKKMRHHQVLPSSSLIDMLDTAAKAKPKNAGHVSRLNGFKGYFQIWRTLMVPQESNNQIP